MARITDKKFTRREVAELLRVKPFTVYLWMKPKTAPCGVVLEPMRIGNRVFYTEAQIAEWTRQVDLRREQLRRKTRKSRAKAS